MTNALTSVSRTSEYVHSEVNVAVPTNSTGVRVSYYTKASSDIQYPATLATVGSYVFRLLDGVTAEIRCNNTQVAVQDITVIEDNRWNLVRFSADFNGAASTGSLEVNGIRVDVTNTDSTVGVSTINIRSLIGKLACIDDIGVNDNTGTIESDFGMPNAIKGFVGGLIEDGDIQNWQQNVASLFPLNYTHVAQGKLLYIPSADKIITYNRSRISKKIN
jgi:hypothetical protein